MEIKKKKGFYTASFGEDKIEVHESKPIVKINGIDVNLSSDNWELLRGFCEPEKKDESFFGGVKRKFISCFI